MTNPTDSVKLSELEALLAKARFCGPLAYQERSDAYTHIVRSGESGKAFVVQFGQTTDGRQEARARLYAALVNAAPALIAQARSTDDLLSALEAICSEFAQQHPLIKAGREAIARHRRTV